MKTTRLQNSIYLHYINHPEDTSYSLPYLWKLKGDINFTRLKQVLDIVFNIHDVYHMYFNSSGNLVLNDELSFKSKIVKMSSDSKLFQSHVIEYVTSDMKRPFKLSEFPLERVILFTNEQYGNEGYLYMNISHAICDVYSAFQLFQEISDLYNSSFNLKNTEKFKDVRQFKDSKTLKHKISTKKEENVIRYLREKINNLKLSTLSQKNLNTDYDYPIVSNEGTCVFDLEQINKLSRELSLSEFEVMLSIYVIFLSKITNSNEVITGIPLANRRTGDKKVHGCFVNNLPLIIGLDDNDTFLDITQKVKYELRNLLRYQEFDILGHISDIFSEDVDNVKFINNSVTYYKKNINFSLNGIVSENLEIPRLNTVFPLEIEFEKKSSKELVVHFQCSSDFDVLELEKTMEKIFYSVLYDSQKYIGEINIGEKDLKMPDYQPIKDILEVISRNVSMNPNKKAVVYNNDSLTYKELDKLSSRLSQRLNEDKNHNNIVVSIKDHLLFLPVLILGILKSGKTYIPLDYNMPDKRKSRIIENINDAIFICDYKTDIISKEVNKIINEDNIAYILFTSGSTGIPKGVKISYTALNSLFNQLDSLNIDQNERWINFHSYGFDYSIFELLGSLYFNGTLYIISPKIKTFPDKLREFIKKNNINILTQTPTAFMNLIDVENHKKDKLSSLHKIFVGGEDFDFSKLKDWISKYSLDNTDIYNLYGVTEATIISTFHKISKDDIKNNEQNNIGSSLKNIKTYVVKNDVPVLKGFCGELYLLGDTIASGYSNYNNEKFFNYNGYKGFKTGDIVKRLANGEYRYIQRNDSQTQIGGHRIELKEIQRILNLMESIEFKVTVKNHRILAYYINHSKEIDETKIRNYAKKNLPKYMIPSFFIKVDEFPLTSNGKIDFNALNTVYFNQNYVANSDDDILNRVLDIWKLILKNQNIGKDDNFFDVGGSSLLISEIYYKILEEFNLDENKMSMIDLFEYTTPSQVANFIKEKKETI